MTRRHGQGSPTRQAEFTTLVKDCDAQMRALAYGILGDQAAMDDVLQNAYVKAYRNFDRFEGRARFSTWLYSIVYRAAIDELRRRRPHVALDDAPPLVAEIADPGDRLSDRQRIAAALGRLPVAQRAVVLLVDVDGLSYEEAAQVLGVAAGTVASRASRARASLRQFLSTKDDLR